MNEIKGPRRNLDNNDKIRESSEGCSLSSDVDNNSLATGSLLQEEHFFCSRSCWNWLNLNLPTTPRTEEMFFL
jgi:hypothetical protein